MSILLLQVQAIFIDTLEGLTPFQFLHGAIKGT